MSDKKPDYHFKVMVFGAEGTGKTSLVRRFVGDTYSDNIEQSYRHEQESTMVEVDGKKVLLHITNRAAHVFVTETDDYMHGVMGVLIVYDITSQSSFNRVPPFVMRTDGVTRKGAQRIIVGNKTDLEDKRELQYSTAKEYADENNLDYIETSAKTPSNVKDLFLTLARYMIEKKQKPKKRGRKSKEKKQENSEAQHYNSESQQNHDEEQQQNHSKEQQEKKSSNFCSLL